MKTDIPTGSLAATVDPRTLSKTERREIQKLHAFIAQHPTLLVAADGATQRLPASLSEMLQQLVEAIDRGDAGALINLQEELTTVQASQMLGVSRQFLCNLIDRGAIPHHMAGTHRRVLVKDLLAYREARDKRRREVLQQMIDEDVRRR